MGATCSFEAQPTDFESFLKQLEQAETRLSGGGKNLNYRVWKVFGGVKTGVSNNGLGHTLPAAFVQPLDVVASM